MRLLLAWDLDETLISVDSPEVRVISLNKDIPVSSESYPVVVEDYDGNLINISTVRVLAPSHYREIFELIDQVNQAYLAAGQPSKLIELAVMTHGCYTRDSIRDLLTRAYPGLSEGFFEFHFYKNRYDHLSNIVPDSETGNVSPQEVILPKGMILSQHYYSRLRTAGLDKSRDILLIDNDYSQVHQARSCGFTSSQCVYTTDDDRELAAEYMQTATTFEATLQCLKRVIQGVNTRYAIPQMPKVDSVQNLIKAGEPENISQADAANPARFYAPKRKQDQSGVHVENLQSDKRLMIGGGS